jgi:hypothetical protein
MAKKKGGSGQKGGDADGASSRSASPSERAKELWQAFVQRSGDAAVLEQAEQLVQQHPNEPLPVLVFARMLYHRPSNKQEELPAVIDRLLALLAKPASVHAAHLAYALASRHVPSEAKRVKEAAKPVVKQLLSLTTTGKEQVTEQDIVDPAEESYGQFTKVLCDNGRDFQSRLKEAWNAFKPLAMSQGDAWVAELEKEVSHSWGQGLISGLDRLDCTCSNNTRVFFTATVPALHPQVPWAGTAPPKAGKGGKGKASQAPAVPAVPDAQDSNGWVKKHRDEVARLLEFVRHKLSKFPEVSACSGCVWLGACCLVSGGIAATSL